MRRIIFLLALASVCIPVFAFEGNIYGDGSEYNPYIIVDLADFDVFADPNNAATYWATDVHTLLALDIDLSGRTYTTAVIAPDPNNTNDEFDGIPYAGIFSADSGAGSGPYGNAVIKNLTIDTAGANNDYLGLFGMIKKDDLSGVDAEIRFLGIKNMSITGGSNSIYLGGLCGRNGDWNVLGGTITNCYSTGIINEGSIVGGLVGGIYNGASIMESYSTSTVDGSGALGGLVGFNAGSITNSYSIGNVNGNGDVGGLVGFNYGSVMNSYSTGSASIPAPFEISVGGLVGFNFGGITNCYSTGSVRMTGGGLVGENTGTVTNSFWDTNTSGKTTSAGGTGMATQFMQVSLYFTDWDFSYSDGDPADWMMLRESEDYPRLVWQEIFAGDIAGLYGVDLVDFVYLANYWGLDDCNGFDDCGLADIDNSDDVDLGDLIKVADNWLNGK